MKLQTEIAPSPKGREEVRQVFEDTCAGMDHLAGLLGEARFVQDTEAVLRTLAEAKGLLEKAFASAIAPAVETREQDGDSRAAKLVKWVTMTPTIQERFAQVANLFLDEPEGTKLSLRALSERLGWHKEGLPGERDEWTRRRLETFKDVRLLECERVGKWEYLYSLSSEARTLIDHGVFRPLVEPRQRAIAS